MKHIFGTSLVLVLSAAIGASLVACSDSPAEDVAVAEQPIVGGVEAQPGAWPGTVALYSGNTQICGGTLVADNWVLTAGHCVEPAQANGGVTKVVIGRHKLSTTDGETRTVKRVIRHPGYVEATTDNDISLLQLTTPSSAPKARILTAAEIAAVVPNATVTVVGWGLTTENAFNSSNVLRQVSVPIMSKAQCSTYSGYKGVTDNMICAGLPQGGKDSCQGDSGGPLFMQLGGENVQVGIVSWGIGCARKNAPGIYTRLGNYLGWLSQTTNGAVGGGGGGGGGTDAGGGGGGAFTPFQESGSVTKNQEQAYVYDVPAGTYNVAMTGTGDADLYVRGNAAPTLNDYDCRPWVNGSLEQCNVNLAAPGKLYVTVRGYAAGASTFTVNGTKEP